MKEFIEIPFGAKDSELGGWEYTIPKGYIANIENGKIIVKKEENEDESISKYLSSFVELNSGVNLPPEDAKKILTWLEKQGENKSKKVSIWKHWKDGIAGNGEGELIYLTKVGNTYSLTSCLAFECDYIELSELDNLMLEKQGKQKPTDEEMKILLQTEYEKGKADAIEAAMESVTKDKESAIKFLKSAGIMNENEELAKEYVADNIEQKTAWSEEDELMLTSIIQTLKLTNGAAQMKIDWLKLLKDRVQPQQEYSEEDIRAIDRACVALRAYSNGELPNFLPSELLGYADKLQSLIPQNRWKPSKEQMYYLSWIANVKLGDGVVEQEVSKHLNELYDDLKKLREE